MFAIEAPYTEQQFHSDVSDQAICQILADEKLAAGEITPEQYHLVMRDIKKSLNHAQRCWDRKFELHTLKDLEPINSYIH